MNRNELMQLPKEQLVDLIEIYSKNWLAMDGVWFQSVEQKYGMEEAIFHDREAWKRFTVIEARRIRSHLKLPEHCGLDGLAQALNYRLSSNVHEDLVEFDGSGALIYTVTSCRVQHARAGKGMPLHPCKSVAFYEFDGFAKALDDRIRTECLSCYPDITDCSCSCKWRFTID